MKKHFTLLLIALAFSLQTFAQSIDATASRVDFSISNMKFNTVEGGFTGMEGTVIFLPNNLSQSKFEVCVDAASVDTDNKKRDAHLRKPDFFDVEKYPNICFSSSKITKNGTEYKVVGTLTLHGVSKEIEIPFSYTDNTLTGAFTLNRFDYKLGEDTGTFLVGEEVSVKVVCVLGR